MKWTNQPEEYRTNNNPTDPTFTGAPGTTPIFQPPSSGVVSTESHPAPIIRSENQSYQRSWHAHNSGARCHHATPDKPGLLRHLAALHQVFGGRDAEIIFRLSDSRTHSACNMSIKRGNYPRHVDTHYPVRYRCQYCDGSFSRQDS